MLFNSYVFVFLFLPVVVGVFYLVLRGSPGWQASWLAASSLFFYAYWNVGFVPVLLTSICLNYGLGRAILAATLQPTRQKRLVLLGVTLNLAALGYYKYLFPFANFLHDTGLLPFASNNVILPLGISFFTFTQIGYLIECKQGYVKSRRFLDYILFVTFFPHLIAGPILRNPDIAPQFSAPETYRFNLSNVTTGLTWFVFGLAKKVLLADNLAPAADYGFAMPGQLGALQAWHSVLSYSLQLYFDFSGYSDMAIGLALLFNIRFPINFDSPYKSTSIIDFWQRWNMTLTRFLTAYLFNPIALAMTRRRAAKGQSISKQGVATLSGFSTMVALPTILTMTLIGIWHGAGLQFVLFGALHGLYLTINHAWRIFRRRTAAKAAQGPGALLWPILSLGLTYLCVAVSEVFFRADTCGDALRMIASMLGQGGVGETLFLNDTLLSTAMRVAPRLFGPAAAHPVLASAAVLFLPLLLAYVWVLGAPNVQQMIGEPGRPGVRSKTLRPSVVRWQPNLAWAAWIGALGFLSIGSFSTVQRFIYFQF
jgi:D-alanyl-lipoteichoic acid acyltransferase DltB (MBOAT superfamily)